MSLKQNILNFISQQSKVTLSEIYNRFEEIKKSTLRGRVNEATKQNLLIRISKGTYILFTKDNNSDSIIIKGNSLELVPELLKHNIKYDLIFLDIPYNLGGQKGGNRNLANYDLIEPEEFQNFLTYLEQLLKTDESQIYMMIAGGKSSITKAMKYLKAFDNTSLILAGEGSYTKLTSAGKICNMGKYLMPAEIIKIYNKSGVLPNNTILNFACQRPSLPKSGGYPTQKPISMLTKIVKQATKIGDLIFDPFGGSGAMLESAITLGRKIHTFDISSNSIENFIIPKIKGLT